ncbi:MAG: hypothetical protein O3A31_10645 [Planctomycetota bacterium]|nr:hypothetical protein [Planctomycetota bacterium]
MQLKLVDYRFHQQLVQTRVPFKFGVQVLRQVPLAELEVTVVTSDGRRGTGRASDLLVPKWFEKDPDATPEADSAALARSVEAAVSVAKVATRAAGPHPVFDIAEIARIELVGSRNHSDADVLVRGFGVAMLERTLIDAACRLAGMSFDDALRQNIFGFSASRLIPEVGDWSPSTLPAPATSMAVRHTVGMLDPLTVGEIRADERIDDGLPQALEEDIAVYGVKRFKVKIGGDHAANLARLRAVAAVVSEMVGPDAIFTLDGNEQCVDLEGLAGLLEDLQRDPATAPMIARLALIEQPLPRHETFDESQRPGLARLSRIAPVIIDEADTDRDAFRRAIDLGYAGVSVKACKGVFRAIANRGLLEHRRAAGAVGLFQSGEDLTNLGSIPLQQDLCLQAQLGVADVERNGHHYFRGLDHLAPKTSLRLSRELPALYREGDDGRVRVRIEDGELRIDGVVNGVGFGGPLGSLASNEDAD